MIHNASTEEYSLHGKVYKLLITKMVAEPVHATLDTLSMVYNRTTDFVIQQAEKLQDMDFNQYNPLRVNNPQVAPHVSARARWGDKLWDNKYRLTTILTIGIGVSMGTYYYYNGGNYGKMVPSLSKRKSIGTKPRRRVPKLANGARQDVVLVVGSPTEPMTRLIALDFERRGFIVYLTILDEKDLKYTESNPITEDINYLNIAEGYSFETQISRFNQLLQIPVVPFPGADAHTLKLVAVVFTPNLYFPIGPLENITVASWIKITDRLSTYLKLFASGLISLIRQQHCKTILMCPNITSALSLPYHGPESMVQNALQSLFTTLTREISQHKLSVTQIKLGNISILAANGSQSSKSKTSNLINFEIKGWNEDMKSLYSKGFSKSQHKSNPIKSAGKGTNLRDLCHLLFDLIYSSPGKNSSVVYCGTGARAYDWLASLVPTSLLQWILS